MPEIQRCNLASIILQLKTIGVQDILNFRYMQAPSRESLKRSLQQLLMLGALDRKTVGVMGGVERRARSRSWVGRWPCSRWTRSSRVC